MIIKLSNKNIVLSAWKPIKQVPFGGYNWLREDLSNPKSTIPADPNTCCIHTGNDYHAVYFSGTLKSLDKLYLEIFNSRDLYLSVELAKERIDKFLSKYDKLLVFI